MASILSKAPGAALIAAVAAVAFFAPTAAADEDAPSGPTQWNRLSDGSPYPSDGWRSCAEAAANGVIYVKRGQPGYNPALDPAGSGFECIDG
ncbi:hypothetical protein Srot_2030 [Segniliparus rotundus DSM 44985]|uniref:Excalibur domain protein n=1 Tax=Segniliparus rotundus (strain ATCC BAA-972 / CDC 1076 / CIP 108378 / DSM 44985 / JCM 13578) TaxID=640132 RepID=D6Z956_SEGRD|nr:excalibur calcium-binding domain-containing protein [Segniliparus rotundus]ADG98486.1 hypothetical protein Srot_2030 [Segniliparus rotundus DSM 44985]